MQLGVKLRNYAALPDPARNELFNTDAVGIELEYEQCDLSASTLGAMKQWRITDDGSLRNGGIELISMPLLPNEVEPALQEAERIVRAMNAVSTPRCGLHTHMNMLPYTCGQVWSLACLYALIEPTLYATYAIGREDSMFAVPLWSNTEQTDALYRDICHMRSFATPALVHVAQTSKYAALNFSSLTRFGTIEMRQPYCSTNFDAIRSWVQFCQRLVRIGVGYTDPLHLLDEYETEGLRAVQIAVFGDEYAVCPEKQEHAEDAAWTLVGFKEPEWQDLTWEFPILEAS